MTRGVHGEKLVAALESDKLPEVDIPRIKNAIERYDKWITDLNAVDASDMEKCVNEMVTLLNDYKYYIDVDLIFDSKADFLYRQKGQTKIDNTVMEEFLPILVKKCLAEKVDMKDIHISSQVPTYSSMYFESGLCAPNNGGGMRIKTKNQDFSMSRTLYLRSSYSKKFESKETCTLETHLGYIVAEAKTNLDKTMFQEASSTAHDVKTAVTGSHYYLLADFLDMPPISTAMTDIDEIILLRKAKRLSSNVRKKYSKYKDRQENREGYTKYLKDHPYCPELFLRFLNHIISQLSNEKLVEEDVVKTGYF